MSVIDYILIAVGFATTFYMFSFKNKDKQIEKLEDHKKSVQKELDQVKQEESTLKAKAIESQANATEEQKKEFWDAYSKKDSNDSTNK